MVRRDRSDAADATLTESDMVSPEERRPKRIRKMASEQGVLPAETPKRRRTETELDADEASNSTMMDQAGSVADAASTLKTTLELVASPTRTRPVKAVKKQTTLLAIASATSPTENPNDMDEIVNELVASTTSFEHRDALLTMLTTEEYIGEFRDRLALLKKMIECDMDIQLISLQPVPRSVAVFFCAIFNRINSAPAAKTQVMDKLFSETQW